MAENQSLSSGLIDQKEYFHKNAHLTESEDILRAVNGGRWYLKNEIIGVIQLKRQMIKTYNLLIEDSLIVS